MKRAFGSCLAFAFLGLPVFLSGQDSAEKERVLCDPDDPGSGCPGSQCLCVDDTIEIVFDGDSDSVLEYSAFTDGMEFEVTVITDTKSQKARYWAYGVAHDEEFLQLVSVTTEGTTAGDLNFWVMACGPLTEECTSVIQTCGEDPACGSDGRKDGGGWFSATLLDWQRGELPLNRNSLARATYRLRKDVGEAGTLIRFSDRLAPESSPPVSLFLTVDGKSRLWSTAVEGWVRKAASSGSFSRGDLDSSGRINILDVVLSIRALFGDGSSIPDCDDALDANDDGKLNVLDSITMLDYLFRKGPPLPLPFLACGIDGTSDTLECLEPGCP